MKSKEKLKAVFRISLSGFVLFIYASQLFSQELKFKHFDVEDGLPSSQVFSVFQDNEGYMWLTTDNGLSRYDGYSFVNFSIKDGLIDNTVLSAKVSVNNNILFLTLSSGFFWYKSGEFNRIKSPQYDKLLGARARVNQQYFLDKNETIWFTTNKLGEYYSLDTLGNLVTHKYSNLFSGNNKLGTYVIDLKGKILLAPKPKKDQIFPLTPKSGWSKNVNFVPWIINKQVFKTKDTLMFLAREIETSLNKIFLKTKNQKIVSKTLPLGNAKKFFTHALADDENDVWIGTESGVYFFKEGNFNIVPQHFLKGYYVTYIFQDHEKNIWVATKDDGIFLLTGKKIRNYLPSDKVIALSPYGNYLWVATMTGKVIRVDSANNFLEILNLESKNVISAFSVSQDGIFIGNNIYDLNGKTIKSGKKSNAKKIINFGKSLWLVANHEGAIYVGRVLKGHRKLPNFSLRTNALLLKPPKELLLGSIKGLFLYNLENETVKDIRKGSPLLSTRIMEIKKWRDAYLLATKGNGLVIYSKDTLFAINTSQGLKSNMVRSITVENDTTIWVGSNAGISKITLLPNKYSIGTIYNYTNIEGLASNEVMDISFYNRKIWVATSKGLSCFSPGNENIFGITPKLKIEEVLINNKIKTGGNKLSLAPDENNILINYLGISFKTLGNIKYRHRLKGYGNQWVTTQSRSANFTNIPAGKYVFEVQAQNKDGVWGNSKKVTFTIAQHFTKKAWFILLIIIILISIPSGVIYTVFKNKKEKEKQKRKALEAELFALRNQVSPHFIFNALNSIQSYNVKSRDKEAINYLSKFSDLMRQILENTKHSFISLEVEIECITNYLNIERLRTNNRFIYNISIDNNINRLGTFIPPMLIQPHLENAIWKGFTKEIIDPFIEIDLSVVDDSLIIKIRDNGIGINRGTALKGNENKQKSYESTGIKNIINRIEHIKQLYSIDISLNIYDLSEKEENKNGTEIYYTISLLKQKPSSIN